MPDEIVYKKVTRKADKGLEGKVIAKHGKQTNQKLKPYVVPQYLLKYSDENNTKSAYDIIGYLEDCGISAERRSIYRDIEEINRIMLMLQEDIDLDEVDMMFAGLILGMSAKYSKISIFRTSTSKEFWDCSRNLSMYFL